MYMFRRAVIVAIPILASGVALGAQTPPATTSAPQTMSQGKGKAASMTADQAFVKEAAIGGMAEVALGQLASTKATNDKVKAFAQRMVTDHGKANDESRRSPPRRR
jgi:putative membrane protein